MTDNFVVLKWQMGDDTSRITPNNYIIVEAVNHHNEFYHTQECVVKQVKIFCLSLLGDVLHVFILLIKVKKIGGHGFVCCLLG